MPTMLHVPVDCISGLYLACTSSHVLFLLRNLLHKGRVSRSVNVCQVNGMSQTRPSVSSQNPGLRHSTNTVHVTAINVLQLRPPTPHYLTPQQLNLQRLPPEKLSPTLLPPYHHIPM